MRPTCLEYSVSAPVAAFSSGINHIYSHLFTNATELEEDKSTLLGEAGAANLAAAIARGLDALDGLIFICSVGNILQSIVEAIIADLDQNGEVRVGESCWAIYIVLTYATPRYPLGWTRMGAF